MLNLRRLGIGDKLIALIAPVLGGALLAGISIATDVLSGRRPDFFEPAYVLENALYAAAGALLSGALFAARYAILAARSAEASYLQVPWAPEAASGRVRAAKLEATAALGSVFQLVDTNLKSDLAQELAVRVLHSQLAEQAHTLDVSGRLQFISPDPKNAALHKGDSVAARALGSDGYDLIVATARAGDVVQASDFQNSRCWWLNSKVAWDFFRYNLEILKKGATITRIFGRNHPRWDEDEAGAKQRLIDLQAAIAGVNVYTIDYRDFDGDFDIKPLDQMVLMHQGVAQPSIEWQIDSRGNTEKVFFVLGRAGLTTLTDNFAKLLGSAERGSSLRAVTRDKRFDPRSDDGYRQIREAFQAIAEAACSPDATRRAN